MPPSNGKVLVVGTTQDYIDRIRDDHPGRAFFLTDLAVIKSAGKRQLPSSEELPVDFKDYSRMVKQLKNRVRTEHIHLAGVTSFDCESMDAAAYLASIFQWPYPDRETIDNCRNKYKTHDRWHRHQVACPLSELIRTEDDAVRFYEKTAGACVLKPATGSGSELVFCCDSEKNVRKSFRCIKKGMERRSGSRMYSSREDANGICLAEEMVQGEEFSADFIIENDIVTPIRIARKIVSQKPPFGTARAYILIPRLEPKLNQEVLCRSLYLGAKALGIKRAMCMADFIIKDGKPVFLEMAPRPGGDCLPSLLKTAWGIDMFQLNLDFSAGKSVELLKTDNLDAAVGLRIHSSKGGILKTINSDFLLNDPRLLEIQMIRKPGHRIILPPDDYDSWYMGYLIFKPNTAADIESQCDEFTQKIEIFVE